MCCSSLLNAIRRVVFRLESWSGGACAQWRGGTGVTQLAAHAIVLAMLDASAARTLANDDLFRLVPQGSTDPGSRVDWQSTFADLTVLLDGVRPQYRVELQALRVRDASVLTLSKMCVVNDSITALELEPNAFDMVCRVDGSTEAYARAWWR